MAKKKTKTSRKTFRAFDKTWVSAGYKKQDVPGGEVMVLMLMTPELVESGAAERYAPAIAEQKGAQWTFDIDPTLMKEAVVFGTRYALKDKPHTADLIAQIIQSFNIKKKPNVAS